MLGEVVGTDDTHEQADDDNDDEDDGDDCEYGV